MSRNQACADYSRTAEAAITLHALAVGVAPVQAHAEQLACCPAGGRITGLWSYALSS